MIQRCPLRYMAAESTINAPSGSRYMAGAHWGIDDLKNRNVGMIIM